MDYSGSPESEVVAIVESSSSDASQMLEIAGNLMDAGLSQIMAGNDPADSRCFYLNNKLAVCAPVDPAITTTTNLLEKRSKMKLPECYTVIHGHNPENKIEVCSTSRQEAHSQIVKEVKQFSFLASNWKWY